MKPILFALACLISTPSFAGWIYQPEGKQITMKEAAAKVVAQDKTFAGFTFVQGHMFVEFGIGDTTSSYARANSVSEFENEINLIVPIRTVVSGHYKYLVGWNKLFYVTGNGSEKKEVYNAFTDFRSDFQSAKEAGPIKDKDDSRGKMIYTYEQRYTLLSMVGPDVTYYATMSGDGGGAHGYAWSGMSHKNFGYGQDTLLDLVDNQGLLDALKANPTIIKEAGSDLDSITQITDFDAAAREFTEAAGNGTAWQLEAGEQWKKFSLWDYDPATQMATIRIGLEYISEVSRGSFSQLEVKVKVKGDFAATLADLKNGKIQGQLMKDVPAAQQPPLNGRDDE
ncbi:MAG: hypothetical protein ACXVCG_19670 [Bdellovibrionota bacterium]